MSHERVPYVLRQGDYLAKLPHVFGFDADEVWKDPKNEVIRSLRVDHNILAPGDIVYLPKVPKDGLPILKGKVNAYTAKVPTVEVALAFQNADGTPLADEPYEVQGVDLPSGSQKTDGEGKLRVQLRVTIRAVTIVFPERHFEYTARVGDLDPLAEQSGVEQRLENLAVLVRDAGSAPLDEDALRAAITVFQAKKGLDPTGTLDEATRGALLEEHGV
ncbi:MAG: peptidoglycan-binding domain-containing protein [Minicystis sp.]